MGIGSKIKKVLTDDEPTHLRHHRGSDPSKGPGGYPDENVPRSFNRIDKYGNNIVDPKATGAAGAMGAGGMGGAGGNMAGTGGNIPGRSSADYTYGSNTGGGGMAGAGAGGMTGRHSHEIPGNQRESGVLGGNQRESGILRKGLPGAVGGGAMGAGAGAAGGHMINKNSDPYWGDSQPNSAAAQGSGAGGSGVSGLGAGAYNHCCSDMAARDVNDRYNNTAPGEGLSQTGASGWQSGRQEASGMGSGGGNGMGSGMGSAMGGSMAGGMAGGAASQGAGRGGVTSSMGQIPMESGDALREQNLREQNININDYDAPPSAGRAQGGMGGGTGGVGAGAGAGAAAGLGASQLGNRNQISDLRGGNPGLSYRNGEYQSVLDPARGSSTANKPGTGVGTSMLDPYGTGQAGDNMGTRGAETMGPGSGGGNDIPIRLRDDLPSQTHNHGQGQGMNTQNRSSGVGSAMGSGNAPQTSTGIGKTGSPDSNDQMSRQRDSGYGQGGGPVGQGGQDGQDGQGGQGGDNLGNRSSKREQESSLGTVQGPSSEHFGPGHQGAKVFHKCYNCGVDNDISRHFRKDAVYRMG
ncbi:hypothetical protein KJ359_011104 [Pestalotiopsis sp. 9143b]|nr:hypothetical protein KJ359_011104 [Pestalotiopsis sp. 9143b]